MIILYIIKFKVWSTIFSSWYDTLRGYIYIYCDNFMSLQTLGNTRFSNALLIFNLYLCNSIYIFYISDLYLINSQ